MSARKILLATQTVSTVTVGLLGPIWAIYVEKIGGDILAASTTAAAFSLAYGFLMIFLGKFTDRVKETEYFIIAGFFLSTLGFLGYLLVKNPTQLFLVQIVLGIALVPSPKFQLLHFLSPQPAGGEKPFSYSIGF